MVSEEKTSVQQIILLYPGIIALRPEKSSMRQDNFHWQMSIREFRYHDRCHIFLHHLPCCDLSLFNSQNSETAEQT